MAMNISINRPRMKQNCVAEIAGEYQAICTEIDRANARAVAKGIFERPPLPEGIKGRLEGIREKIEKVLKKTGDGETLSESQIERINNVWIGVAHLLQDPRDCCVIV